MSRVIAVDWSGATYGARKHIWLAEAREPGHLVRLESGRDRSQLSQHLLAVSASDIAVVGLDFAFSFPEWFVCHLGVRSAPELWMRVAERGEAWLQSCEPPFWGRPGRKRPEAMSPPFRKTELSVPAIGNVRPKSIFQIGGAGAVGTGSLRGMPFLHALLAAGAAIWPFTTGRIPIVVEIYPRLLTGPVHKSSAAARAAYLAARYPCLADDHRRHATQSEDAFDAAVSALVMIEHVADLSTLPAQSDPVLRLEGRIWHPSWRCDAL